MTESTDRKLAVLGLVLAGCGVVGCCAASFAAGLARGGRPAPGPRRAITSNARMLVPASRSRLDAERDPSVIDLVTPIIDMDTAEHVLSQIERLPADSATVILHTYGGSLRPCVLIADALKQLPRCTAVIPYMAASGGTLIALSASVLAMGANASLTAVDPIVEGHRVRHIPNNKKHAELRAHAREYEAVVNRYMRALLGRHLGSYGKAELARAMSIFMGEDAPHEWPIRREEARALGLPVVAAERKWSSYVDRLRRGDSVCP